MNYYEVYICDKSYRGNQPLTYSCDSRLKSASIVEVELRNKKILGIINKKVTKPEFKTKQISNMQTSYQLDATSIDLMHWMIKHYPSPSGYIPTMFVPSHLLSNARGTIETKPKEIVFISPPKLTKDQLSAINQINNSKTTVILMGETGSGKTRVYIELAKKCLENGKSVMVLTPEIGLTPQLANEFSKIFGNSVFVNHSGLTPAKKRKIWIECAKNDYPKVIIGPRSSLFLPVNNLGLIVVDEAHDESYKQDQTPYYHALRVASKLSEINNARCVIATATPNVVDSFFAKAKNIPIIKMSKRELSNEVIVEVIDLRKIENLSPSSFLSRRLIEATRQALGDKEQVMMFLNRRGTAKLVQCQECFWQAMCPRCDSPLTYHSDNHRYLCHGCGYSEKSKNNCPICKSQNIEFKTVGTKAIVNSLQKEFPRANIVRFDSDNKKSDSLQTLYIDLAKGKIDILVGTQIITKGLDLPKLGLVGVIVADSSLSFPDFTSEERTFQMISQIIGRVGRVHRAGKVILQTYNPDNEIIKDAISNNWDNFYENQLSLRQKFMFPPYCFLLKLTISYGADSNAKTAALKLKSELEQMKLKISISDPSPSFFAKLNNKHRWQIIVKSKNRSDLLKVIECLPSNWSYNIDPINLM